jgi:hypothetical protein
LVGSLSPHDNVCAVINNGAATSARTGVTSAEYIVAVSRAQCVEAKVSMDSHNISTGAATSARTGMTSGEFAATMRCFGCRALLHK